MAYRVEWCAVHIDVWTQKRKSSDLLSQGDSGMEIHQWKAKLANRMCTKVYTMRVMIINGKCTVYKLYRGLKFNYAYSYRCNAQQIRIYAWYLISNNKAHKYSLTLQL